MLAISVLAIACSEKREEPEHLLSEQQMEDILYDISILQAIQSFSPRVLDTNKVDPKYYIYHKYDIDSATFTQNNNYYAADLELYEKIEDRVLERISQKRDSLRSVNDSVKAIATKPDTVVTSTGKAKIDSIRMAAIKKARESKK
ncbi:DUF4296 domain-containing protein [Flavobacterium rhizosphaerae]|uniref:DUF4296 domain-containing protein n=1 Tax=Flavobacterium rhizosphaerae TaxID=3163298 RepID=A0ABW8YWD2_9FLAO